MVLTSIIIDIFWNFLKYRPARFTCSSFLLSFSINRCEKIDLICSVLHFAALILTYNTRMVAFPSCGSIIGHPHSLRAHVHHLHRRGTLRWHKHIRLHGGRGKFLGKNTSRCAKLYCRERLLGTFAPMFSRLFLTICAQIFSINSYKLDCEWNCYLLFLWGKICLLIFIEFLINFIIKQNSPKTNCKHIQRWQFYTNIFYLFWCECKDDQH